MELNANYKRKYKNASAAEKLWARYVLIKERRAYCLFSLEERCSHTLSQKVDLCLMRSTLVLRVLGSLSRLLRRAEPAAPGPSSVGEPAVVGSSEETLRGPPRRRPPPPGASGSSSSVSDCEDMEPPQVSSEGDEFMGRPLRVKLLLASFRRGRTASGKRLLQRRRRLGLACLLFVCVGEPAAAAAAAAAASPAPP